MYYGGMAQGNHPGECPTRLQADGAFFFVPRGDRLAVRTRWLRHRNVSSNLAPRAISGPVAAETAASPCRQPRDWAPEYPTVTNIARADRNFHLATLSHNVSDWARHEYPRK